jgi:hypothetical protein
MCSPLCTPKWVSMVTSLLAKMGLEVPWERNNDTDFLKEQIKYSTSSNKYGTQNWFCLQCEDFGEIAAWHTRLWFLCTLPLLAYFFSTTCMWFLAIFWSMVSHTIKLGILSSIYIPIKTLKSSYTSEREISISKPTWDIIPGLLMPTSSFAYIPPHNFCSS